MDTIRGHELHGARQVGQWPADELVDLWGRACSGVVKHGFVIEYRDLEPPKTGIFDGLRIVIDPDVGFEMQCVLLLHLFGHSVQWVAPSLEHKLGALQHTTDRAVFMQVLRDYEFEAAGFAMQLMHEVGITTLDQWFSDFVETDWRYVEGYYATDRLPEWQSCVTSGCPLITPSPIPVLHHREVEVRFAF
jgi:alpha-ketoglutarate-dependent taurine dioxygenase